MDFPVEFFEDEIREGFYIPGPVKSAWAAQMEVLSEIDRICKKNKIKYMLAYGSLLGAVRHGGMIPWDDDFDLWMTRRDLEKFKKICEKALPKGYSVLSFSDSDTNYWHYITRVINCKSFELSDERMNKFHYFPFPAGIDIFCLDNVPKEEGEKDIIMFLTKLIQQAANYLDDEMESSMTEEDYETALRGIEDLSKQKIDRNGNVKLQLYRLNDMIFSMYVEDDSEYLAVMPQWIKTEGSYKFKKEWIAETIDVEFENTTYPIPKFYDEVLKYTYGLNYMVPRKSGGAHDYPFIKKSEAEVKPKIGEAPFVYVFNENDLKNDKRIEGRNAKQQAFAFADVLSAMHANIKVCANNGEYEKAVNGLIECQNTAIEIGNMIDAIEGEGNGAVKKLEEYCEQVFNCFNDYENGNINPESHYERLEKVIKEYKEAVITCMRGRLEVLFIPYKPEMWYMMEKEYKKYAEDPECDVYVMPIPWYHKTPLGYVITNHYDLDKYNRELNLVVYNKYDMEKRHPDIIYIQNPYDQCNFITSVHPTFYASELKKHTEKLVYMPYFEEMNITEEDERDIFNMKYYVTVPGVIHSDEIILRSENEKKLYVNKLSEFAGENTRKIWEDKIVVK